MGRRLDFRIRARGANEPAERARSSRQDPRTYDAFGDQASCRILEASARPAGKGGHRLPAGARPGASADNNDRPRPAIALARACALRPRVPRRLLARAARAVYTSGFTRERSPGPVSADDHVRRKLLVGVRDRPAPRRHESDNRDAMREQYQRSDRLGNHEPSRSPPMNQHPQPSRAVYSQQLKKQQCRAVVRRIPRRIGLARNGAVHRRRCSGRCSF